MINLTLLEAKIPSQHEKITQIKNFEGSLSEFKKLRADNKLHDLSAVNFVLEDLVYCYETILSDIKDPALVDDINDRLTLLQNNLTDLRNNDLTFLTISAESTPIPAGKAASPEKPRPTRPAEPIQPIVENYPLQPMQMAAPQVLPQPAPLHYAYTPAAAPVVPAAPAPVAQQTASNFNFLGKFGNMNINSMNAAAGSTSVMTLNFVNQQQSQQVNTKPKFK